MTSIFPVASAHGRFQPLHNEHLEYLRAAKGRCEFLWIGITMPDITPLHLNPLGRHRERADANPLTYFERISIITEALVDLGIARTTFDFVPFPIETPPSLNNYVPTNIPCLTTVCEPWNREKIAVLESVGYSVHILFERQEKKVTGFEIRRRVMEGDATWRELVPTATARAIERLDLRSRLIRISSQLPESHEP
jgi:nicotinamide mononucleotide adenylyltransferase